jgi:hypothetical protein
MPRKRFPRISEIECSACPSDLLIHIVHPCTPSQPPPPHSTIRRRHPRTAPAAAASPYPRLRPVPAGTRAACRRCCAPSAPRSLCECRRRCRSRDYTNPTTEQTPSTASSYVAKYFRPSLNCLPSSPSSSPREISRHFFFFFFIRPHSHREPRLTNWRPGT